MRANVVRQMGQVSIPLHWTEPACSQYGAVFCIALCGYALLVSCNVLLNLIQVSINSSTLETPARNKG